MPCRVLLVDDHQIVRQGLRGLLEKAGHAVVGEAADGREALKLTQKLTPDAVVMDLSMPQLNGVDAAREICRREPHPKIVLLTMHSDKAYVLQALRVGIKGYVLKTQAADDLLSAIQAILAGQVYISPGIADSVVEACLNHGDSAMVEPLTSRERQVLQLVAEGQTTKDIANALHISAKTVESHRYHIMKKLGIHELAGLVRYAIGKGLAHL